MLLVSLTRKKTDWKIPFVCLTSWWVSARDTPSTENVKTACSTTDRWPMPTILDRVFSESTSSTISADGLAE